MGEIDDFLEGLELELRRSPHTVTAYGNDLRQFAAWLTGGRPEEFRADDVTTADIRAWLASMARAREKATTIRRKTQSLRAFYRYLLRSGSVDVNPAADIVLARTPKPLPKFVAAADMERLLADAPPADNPLALRDHLIVTLLYATGMRRAELAAVRDSDIDFHSGEIRVHGKRGKDRLIPVAQQLLDEISRWMKARDELWPDMEEPRALIVNKGEPASGWVIYDVVHRALAATPAAKKSPHTLRHTCATALLNDGADLNSVKELLGHSSLATTQIYTHVSFADMKRAYSAAHPRALGARPGDGEKSR